MKVLVIIGTRPEAIKMACLMQVLANDPLIEARLCVTAQHRQMLDSVLSLFDLRPDHDLNVMTVAQSLTGLTATILSRLEPILERERPNIVLVHGDTTTTLAASLAAFYQQIPVGHVEAGLRTQLKNLPWPEEVNRRAADLISDWHFAPTQSSAQNLCNEGIPKSRIFVTGNTVIDALFAATQIIESRPELKSQLRQQFSYLNENRRLLLVTGHRRESFGAPFENLCLAIKDLSRAHDIDVVYPVHLNPNVQAPVRRILAGLDRVHLIEPLEYLPFVYLMQRSHMILTDSGGIQEEAPSLGKPVFVMRDVTERPEALAAGTVRLVGTNRKQIFESVSAALTDQEIYTMMSRAVNPYGDGKASKRIAHILKHGTKPDF